MPNACRFEPTWSGFGLLFGPGKPLSGKRGVRPRVAKIGVVIDIFWRNTKVQITGDRGLVWDIQDILTLRQRYRLVGSMVGGIAGYQSQVSVMGLPMQLAAEEVALAAAAGWITTYQLSIVNPACTASHAATCTADLAGDHLQQQHQQCGPGQQSSIEQQQQQQTQDELLMDAAEEFDEYYAAYYGLKCDKQCEAHTQRPQQETNPPAVQQQHHLNAQQQQQQQQQQQHLQTSQPWQLALKGNSKIRIPLTVADTDAVLRTVPHTPLDTSTASRSAHVAAQQQNTQQNTQQQQQEGTQQPVATSADKQVTCHPVDWQYPRTPLQWLRLGVYADLHARGFYVTGGAKFGGDFLAYPGDPHLYHAHYVVRVLLPHEVLSPTVLQGLARGVHAARKHLVLATVQPNREGSTTRAAANTASGVLPARSGDGGVQCLDDTLAPLGPRMDVAAEIATAAANAAYAGIYSGICIQVPLPCPSKARCKDGVLHGGSAGSVLRYITIARDSGWGGRE